MAALTIRNLDERVKRLLRVQAAEHGVSMEEEARAILRSALPGPDLPNQDAQPALHVAGAGEGKWHLDVSLEELMALGRKPENPIDLKKLSDEMWDESL